MELKVFLLIIAAVMLGFCLFNHRIIKNISRETETRNQYLAWSLLFVVIEAVSVAYVICFFFVFRI